MEHERYNSTIKLNSQYSLKYSSLNITEPIGICIFRYLFPFILSLRVYWTIHGANNGRRSLRSAYFSMSVYICFLVYFFRFNHSIFFHNSFALSLVLNAYYQYYKGDAAEEALHNVRFEGGEEAQIHLLASLSKHIDPQISRTIRKTNNTQTKIYFLFSRARVLFRFRDNSSSGSASVPCIEKGILRWIIC